MLKMSKIAKKKITDPIRWAENTMIKNLKFLKVIELVDLYIRKH